MRSRGQWVSEIDTELMHLSMELDKYLVQAGMNREEAEKYTELRVKVRKLEAVKRRLNEQ